MSDDLDLLFATARQERPVPSGILVERVLTDAYALQPELKAAAQPRRRGVGAFFAGLAEALGGGGVLAGLGTAAVAGVFLGYSGGTNVDWLGSVLLPEASSDVQMLQADDLFLGEG